MATAAQKAKAREDRKAALRAAKAITDKGSKAHKRAIAKVKRLEAVMKEETQSATDHAGAKQKRDAAKQQRENAITKMKAASGADKERYRLQALAAESKMRVQGDIMRDITGRAKGEGTSYIGPSTAAGREERGLPDPTKWQQVNQALKDAGIPWSKEAQADMYAQMFGGTTTPTTTQTGGGQTTLSPGLRNWWAQDHQPVMALEDWWADEQYDFSDWLNQVEGGSELNQYDPAGTLWTGGPDLIPKGKYGMKRGPSSYLRSRGIGHNMAYKPWMPTSWIGSPDPNDPYAGVPGKEAMRDALYHYGGRTPGLLPGNWKPVDPPGGDPAYPLTRVPLFPTGRLSPAGALPSGGKGDDGKDDGGKGDDDKGDTSDTTDSPRGPLLSSYTGMAGATPNALWRITGEPEKITLNPLIGKKQDTYRVPITFYGSGMNDPWKTYATRQSAPAGWNPSFNTWDFTTSHGGWTPAPLQLANWSGTAGAYTGTPNFQLQPGLGFLANPTHTEIQNQMVPYLASEFGGPISSTTPGPLGTGVFEDWQLPAIHGGPEGTGDVVGYYFPRYSASSDGGDQ